MYKVVENCRPSVTQNLGAKVIYKNNSTSKYTVSQKLQSADALQSRVAKKTFSKCPDLRVFLGFSAVLVYRFL